MNERWKELIEQAIHEIGPEDNPSKEETLKRYAELIVKDCVDIMGQQIYTTSVLLSYPGKSSAIWDARNEIFKKYGIK